VQTNPHNSRLQPPSSWTLRVARIEKVLFVSDSDMEEDFDFAAWQAIRPLVDKIDRRLRTVIKGLTETRGGPRMVSR